MSRVDYTLLVNSIYECGEADKSSSFLPLILTTLTNL